MGAVACGGAGYPPIDTCVLLARETGDAVDGIVAAGLSAKASAYRAIADVFLGLADLAGTAELALLAAIRVVFARAAADLKAAGQVLAPGREAFLARRAGVFRIAERVRIWTRRAKGGRLAPGAPIRGASVGLASVPAAAVDRPVGYGAVHVNASVGVDRRVGSSVRRNRAGGGFTATRCGRGDQQNVSEEAHDFGGRREGARAGRTRDGSADRLLSHAAPRGSLTVRAGRPKAVTCHPWRAP